MAWRDILIQLRDELAEARAERQRQAAVEEAELRQAREEISRLAGSLGINEMLSELNATLLDGWGEVETVVSWESAPDDAEDDEDGPDSFEDEDEDDEEEGDVITTILSWEEGGEREIAVDLASAEGGASVQVNGVDVRPERDALEQALVEAFRDELEL